MAPKESNKGWDYLNSHEESSYHNEDGSWGYIESSGEGSYHGSDGSWGYREKDGSISYHGADGSWGYRNKDGSGSYYGANGDTIYYNAKTEDCVEVSTSSSGLGEAIVGAIGVGVGCLAAAAIAQSEKEEQRKQERRKERREFFYHHWKEICGLGLFVLFVIAFLICTWVLGKSIPMGYDVNELVGCNYEYVTRAFHDVGFTNIHVESTEDLHISEIADENKVYQIIVSGKNYFTKSKRYPYDTKITIKYHAVKLIALPFSSKEIKGENYTDILEKLETAGFVNVSVEPVYDIITGWLTDDEEIESITVDGDKKFSSGDEYRPDVKIVITYHTLKENNVS